VHSLSTFGARTSYGQVRTHKIHHGPDLGEATTFPLIVYYAPLHEGHIQMTFYPGTGNLEIPKLGTPAILGAHNFLHRPPIDMRSKAKFPTICGMPRERKEIGLIPDF
jgi:hypothetical protein